VSLPLGEERLGNIRPLFLERTARLRFPRTPIPIRRVREVTLLAMQISMHPCTCWTFIVPRGFMPPAPIPLRIPPQPRQRHANFEWRLIKTKRLTKFLQSHEKDTFTR